YFIAMIALTGIPHGALDHIVANANNVKLGKSFHFGKFLLKYLIAVFLYAICWIYLPSISLLFFLIISAWHFGETDIPNFNKQWLWNINRMLWGSFVLLLILLTHQKETETILVRITSNASWVNISWTFLCKHQITILAAIGLPVLVLSGLNALKNMEQFSFTSFLNLIVILAISIYLPLLPAFAIYFGGWHAIRSFELIFQFLTTQQAYRQMNIMGMWKKTMPMTILAALFFVIASYTWSSIGITSDPLPVVFIFLSVITLPHLDVMNEMIKNS
ncbi:MAG: Brp/Blh family beta-carotene 15,15'-dioxygenase, partial [Chitinophagaceae bacterium]